MLRTCMWTLLLFGLAGVASAAEVELQKLDAGLPDGLAEEVGKSLAPEGFRVVREGKTICDLWFAREWTARSDFKPSATILYPLTPGSLVGAVRFPRKSGDFRGMDIPKGVYTLRYAWQIEDGNHVGTSDTRDFLLAAPAATDTSPAVVAPKDLFKRSAAGVGTSHPAILAMQRILGAAGPLPAALHDEEHDWLSVRVAGKAKAGETASEVRFQFVVQGKGKE